MFTSILKYIFVIAAPRPIGQAVVNTGRFIEVYRNLRSNVLTPGESSVKNPSQGI